MAPPEQGEVSLAVDRNKAGIFDLEDVTGVIRIAGFTLEELRVLVAEGSPDEGASA